MSGLAMIPTPPWAGEHLIGVAVAAMLCLGHSDRFANSKFHRHQSPAGPAT